jgi:hypothetical protein
VSAVVSSADPVGSYTPANRLLFVAVVTPKGWSPANAVTQTQIRGQIGSTSTYWSTVSGGGVTMSVATITAPYFSAYTCSSPWSMWSEAATKTGFASAPNTSLVVELPKGIASSPGSGCSYGLGTLGENVNDSGSLYVSDAAFPVLAHELGHHMSLEHANTLECPSASDSAYSGSAWTGSRCSEVAYDDGSDVMAGSRTDYAPFLSSPQSFRTGILPAAAADMISTGGTTIVKLNALGARSGIRAAEVVDPTNNVTYYVEYRVATLPDTPNIRGEAVGVRVLRFNPETGTTVLLDPTPTASPSTDKDATLRAGGTFTSYSGTVHVTTLSTTPTTATISVTRALPAGFTGSAPSRVLDTRDGTGAQTAKLGAGATLTLTVPGLPAGVTAVALNVTATAPTAGGFLTAYPGGGTRPTASSLNFGVGQTIANLVLVPVGPNNTVTFYNNGGTVHVVADLVGTYAPGTGSLFTGMTPTRVLDTRSSIGNHPAKLGPGAILTLTIPGLPAGVTAVALNVTATDPTAGGFLTVYPGHAARPTASNLNFGAGQTIANLVLVPVGPNNTVTFYNNGGTVNVVADLVGTYAPGTGSLFTGMTPTRVLDTRSSIGNHPAKLGPGATLTLTIPGLPAGVTAVALNVTATDPTAGGFLTVYPGGGTRPTASNLNFGAGQTIANMVLVPVGPGNTVRFYNLSGTVNVIADLTGYYR